MLWQALLRPIFFSLPAETAHYVSMGAFSGLCRYSPAGWLTSQICQSAPDPRLKNHVFGLDFPNPVGLAAGFDKDARWFDVLARLGFGHIEVGTLTGEPQLGNDKPRLFRLPLDRALLNRMGFNNGGSLGAVGRLKSLTRRSVVGVNIGKTKLVELENADGDYLKSFSVLFGLADYFTVNVSSPNTPGLRQLQNRDRLTALLQALQLRNQELAAQSKIVPRPILLKIAPDLNRDEVDDVLAICQDSKLAGIVAANTTIARTGLQTDAAQVERLGAGGISGAPLTNRALRLVSHIYRQTRGELPIIGVGGIMSGEDAWNMICAGASLVQVYTGFIYGGPLFASSLNRKISASLQRLGLDSIRNAIGSRSVSNATTEPWWV
jgi:dihydroorotate dehydrogenase